MVRLYALNTTEPGGWGSGSNDTTEVPCKKTLGKSFVRHCLSQHTGIAPRDLQIAYHPKGKPYLKHSKNIQFNLSHSGAWMICGVSHHPIGVDIEYIKPLSYLEISRRLFHQKEHQFIADASDTATAFFQVWTLKESYLKCLGTGLYQPFGNATVHIGGETITIETIRTEVSKYHFASYNLTKDYRIAVCVENEKPTSYIETISISDLTL